MPFTQICKFDDLWEGECQEFSLGATSIILVWPNEGGIKAFQGRCPHQRIPLGMADFDGKTLICSAHRWVFDAETGQGINPTGPRLAEYPLRITAGFIEIDLTGVGAHRALP